MSGLVASCSNDQNIQGRYLIAADGLHSSVAKAAGLVKALSPKAV